MAFHEDQFPTDISYSARGGPKFKTTVITLVSGREKRNIDWVSARAEYDVAHGVKTQTQLNILLDFFYAQEGMAHGFRYKDWLDYTIGTSGTDASRQLIGTTDGATATFQIYKRYTFGAINYDRTITKPVDGTVELWVNDVSITEDPDSVLDAGNFSVDTTTGIVTLGSTLAAQSGTEVEVICSYDVPARFNTDQMQVSIDFFNTVGLVGSWNQIPIIELRI